MKKKLSLLALVAATYFMVSGGPYGLEELIASAGYSRTIIILIVTPLAWSLPTALMVGELASALPEEGGYYAWARRGLGPFWGFQEAWLSLAASIFDMAIYPTLFTLYLTRLWPGAGVGHMPIFLGAIMIAVCAAWNVRGSNAVGGSSTVMMILLLLPFAALVIFAVLHPSAPADASAAITTVAPEGGIFAGIMVAMWNYMGWDNASTVAGEVDRPQRTYPLAMICAVVLVTLTYVVPVGALARTGIDPSSWTTGEWVVVGGTLGGPWLATAIMVGGVVCGIGMFNALVMSYSRLPAALAEDGFLPAFIARRHPKTDAPVGAIVVCCAAYSACLGLGFARLVEIDVLLYGVSLFLEFATLVALRIREPELARPFRIPGGIIGAVLIGIPPMALLVIALVDGRSEQAGSVSALFLGSVIVAGGPLVYLLRRRSVLVGLDAP
ncbi:MAG: APC family permease [Polyangiaceae bacterium]